jgi:hypothetical protein
MVTNLKKLRQIVNEAYGGDLVIQYEDGETTNVAEVDTLAQFIAWELFYDTYDSSANWDETCDNAITALYRAKDDLERVISALVEAH